MRATKALALAKAKELNVEVEDSISSTGRRHIHLYSPQGFVFRNSTCHNAGAHDSNERGGVDWQHVMEEMVLEPCPDGKACEYCFPEDE